MRSFYGGILHVSYAPEFETINDTREKLRERRQQVERKCKGESNIINIQVIATHRPYYHIMMNA